MTSEIELNLNYCTRSAFEDGETKHPQIIMKKLGIVYQKATVISVADQWWFWNCKNLPKKLPIYLAELDINMDEFFTETQEQTTGNLISNPKIFIDDIEVCCKPGSASYQPGSPYKI